jgi:hypothetical protein
MPQVLDVPEFRSEGRSSRAIDTLQPPALSLDTSPATARTLDALLRAVVSVCTGSRARFVPPLPYPSQPHETVWDYLSRTDLFLYIKVMCG